MNAFVGFATAAAQQAAELVTFHPKRAIDTFTAYVVLREQHQDTLQITDHPVQQGASISDHAYRLPAQVVISAAWSDSPGTASLLDGVVGGLKSTVTSVQSMIAGTQSSSVQDVYSKLLRLQAKREPFDVSTGKRQYKNMLLQSLAVHTDQQTERVLMVEATLREVLIVSTTTTALTSPSGQQKDAAVTGATQDRGTQPLVPNAKEVPVP